MSSSCSEAAALLAGKRRRLLAALGTSGALQAALLAGAAAPLEPPWMDLNLPSLRDAAPHYYTTREVQVKPGIMTRVEPEYPEAAARRFLSGKVVIRLFIDPAGLVERVVTLHAEPPGYFEKAAEAAFNKARFTPAMKDGKPVAVQLTLEVSFDSPPAPALLRH